MHLEIELDTGEVLREKGLTPQLGTQGQTQLWKQQRACALANRIEMLKSIIMYVDV